MNKTLAALLGGLCFLASIGCVGKKVYLTEKNARTAAEAREKVLVNELLDRKKEAADLTKMVGDLNRTLGRQEADIKDLETELISRTQAMGASSSKISTEKAALEKQLATTNELLQQRNEALSRIKHIQEKRSTILAELDKSIQSAFQVSATKGLSTTLSAQSVVLSIQDPLLFESNGVQLNASGRKLLTSLAEFMAARPSLDLEVVTYTDNVLPPKEKSLKDTWDWSIQRATAIVRVLSRELNVNSNQLTAIGRGEFYPVTSNETQEGRIQNRRTELVFLPTLPSIPEKTE